jgi:S1-C subfamily serine protease
LTAYKNGIVGDHAVVNNFGFSFMFCENHALRKLHKMGPKDSGVLITKLQPLGVAAAAGLKEGDILCAIQNDKVSVFI